MVSPVLFSSADDDWETPPAFFDRLDAIFDFQLDAAAAAHNTKCAQYFTRKDDALKQDWHPYKRIWLNPPYGRVMPQWMEKAYRESRKGCMVVCLVPARTDTRWWHEFVHDKALVTFVRSRLKFRNPTKCPNRDGNTVFPSAVVIYGLDMDWLLNADAHRRIGRRAGHCGIDTPYGDDLRQ